MEFVEFFSNVTLEDIFMMGGLFTGRTMIGLA